MNFGLKIHSSLLDIINELPRVWALQMCPITGLYMAYLPVEGRVGWGAQSCASTQHGLLSAHYSGTHKMGDSHSGYSSKANAELQGLLGCR